MERRNKEIREFDVYYRSKVNRELVWCNSFTSIFKNNKRCAQYWVKKMKAKEPNFEFIIVERE